MSAVATTMERFVPYFATTSLRKISSGLQENCKITALQGVSVASMREDKEERRDVGLEVHYGKNTYARVQYKGKALDTDLLLEELMKHNIHDLSIDSMRLRLKVVGKVRLTGWVYPHKIPKQVSFMVREGDELYLDFRNAKLKFDPEKWEVSEDTSYLKMWNGLNTCNVCGVSLTFHRFKHTTLNLESIDCPNIRHTIGEKRTPEIDPYKDNVASWMHQVLIKPSGLHSPNGMFRYELGKQKTWVLAGV